MKKSWTIRIPFQPKDSGKYFHGSFNVLCFEFSDRLPGALNNFLWDVRGLPVIQTISVFLARGGAKRCFRCNKRMYPWQTLASEGNVYESIFPTMDTHTNCLCSEDSNLYKIQFIENHIVSVFYQPDYFLPEVLDKKWEEITERLPKYQKERAIKHPIHKLLAEVLNV
jgi:hypothetical protein